jgi:hypothetical protein
VHCIRRIASGGGSGDFSEGRIRLRHSLVVRS